MASEGLQALPRPLTDRLHEHAKTLLEAENKAYGAKSHTSSSSRQFYSQIISSGTLSDKISALTLAVQESPVHNTKSLESLVGLGRKRSRAQAVEVLRALKDLFAQGILLPADRKLKLFVNQPGLASAFQGSTHNWKSGERLPRGLSESHLIIWAFEDWLKQLFFEVLTILETWCNDEIEYSRSRAVSYVWELLKEKPEQEANLLRLLVNKLGDPSKKLASRTSFLILQLEGTHPMMKDTIISSIESEILFKPTQSYHAKYYAIITLNQTVLSTKEAEVASKLLDIYFALFVKLLSSQNSITSKEKDSKPPKDAPDGRKKGKGGKPQDAVDEHEDELRQKMISAVLAGVNRAYPFTTMNTQV